MKVQIVKIGNSRGIRIPKVWLDQLGLPSQVELSIQRDRLVVRPLRRPRDGWDAQFSEMARRGDARLLDEPVPTRWDREEWQW